MKNTYLDDLLKVIKSKKEKLDAFGVLPEALSKNLYEWNKIELTYTSNAIEGNTLTLNETAIVVEKNITIGGKTINEHLEALNHAQAIDFISQLALTKKRAKLTTRDIFDIHRLVLQKIDDSNAGFLRRISVRVLGSATTFPNYLKLPDLMDDFESWLKTATGNVVEVAALAHLKLVSIHPFADGNGRTARLLMNLILLQEGYPLVIIKKEDRSKYIKSIEKARLSDNLSDFYGIVFKSVEDSLDCYLKALSESKV